MSNDAPFEHEPTNLSMPSCTVIPVLEYPDVPKAVAWLCRAFGFTERLRIGTHRVQVGVGQGAIVIAQGSGSDSGAQSRSHSTMVRVRNIDAHYEAAKLAGAEVSGSPVTQPYGERQYSAIDLAGHLWTFSQTMVNTEPSSWGGQMVAGDESAA